MDISSQAQATTLISLHGLPALACFRQIVTSLRSTTHALLIYIASLSRSEVFYMESWCSRYAIKLSGSYRYDVRSRVFGFEPHISFPALKHRSPMSTD